MTVRNLEGLARAGRIAALAVPSLAAGWVAYSATREDALLGAASGALGPLALVMAAALAVRFVEAAIARRRSADGPPLAAHFDVLTASGRAVMWLGAAALLLSRTTGWASLAVVGLLGVGVVYATVIWTALVAGGRDPWRFARVTRSLTPALAVEGDPLREEVRLSGVRVPPGFTLFVRGGAGGRGDRRVSRYAVGAEASGAEVALECDLGPARRGHHELAPLALWLGDLFGLTRTPTARLGAARYTALPRPGAVDDAKKLFGRGGDDQEVVPANKLPSEGWFRLREYAPGDDTRRIHWLRSLQARQLVVRLPDEVPPAEPAVRLVLDHHLIGVESLRCRAPDELLDALVRVWLGVGRSLADAGVRVNLVAATRRGDSYVATERPLRARALEEGLRLGARVEWQGALPLSALLTARDRERVVVVSSRPRPLPDGDAPEHLQWVVVPEAVWTSPEPWPAPASPVRLPFPAGSAENRFSRRWRARRAVEEARLDGAIFNDLMLGWTDWKALRGAYVARPSGARVALEVIS